MTKILIVTCILAGALAGCDGGKSCVDLCTEAQAGDCSFVQGSCTSFCSALGAVEEQAGCTEEREAYQACLDDGDAVCSNLCNTSESALGACLGTYCLANPTNASCQALQQSL